MGRPTVWIISDRPELLRELRGAAAMAGLKGFSGDIETGFGGGADVSVDLIVLDAGHSGISVPALLARLAERPQDGFIPVIAITSDDVAARVRALSDGAHECISHPFHAAELTARMAGLLRFKALQDKIRLHEAALASANRELVRLATLKDQFIATLSHELRTPLTAINEFTSLVLDEVPGKLNDGQRECLEVTHGNCQHLALMIDDMLNLSGIVTGDVTLVKGLTNLVELVDESLCSLAHMAANRKVRVVMESDSDVVVASVDRLRLRQVLANLVSNAIKFTPMETEVRVVVESDPEAAMARLIVIDQGPGLSLEQQQVVFDRFFQTEPARISKNGLGLGLAVCLEIVSMHRGHMRVESEVGAGCRFYVELPLNEAASGIGHVTVLGQQGPRPPGPPENRMNRVPEAS